MSQAQRYISTELTHFIGRKLSNEEEQYSLLVNIINSGWLTHPPHNKTEKNSGELTISHGSQISKNEMYSPEVICFCDIPENDLSIHMEKYSCFGLSFHKSFLVKKGANPIFYIANDSTVKDWPNADKPDVFHEITRSKLLDLNLDNYQSFCRILSIFFKDLKYNSVQVIGSTKMEMEIQKLYSQLFDLEKFLDFHVFSFMKCFDSSKTENDPDNFYMEREWRMLGNLHFGLKEVCRVFLPKAYSQRFHQDVPEYHGQITFSETNT